MSLLPVAQAQARLLALATPLPGEAAPLEHCIGRWLVEDVRARRNQPWADLSAMDGYAIRHADLPGPWAVTGESAAGGARPPAISAGQAARIFTGAPLPDGSDTVLMQEDVVRSGDAIALNGTHSLNDAPYGTDPVMAGAHVRRSRSDFAEGAVLLPQGSRLGPAQLALAAVGGHNTLLVGKRPRIALLSTGNELVAPGTDASPDKLPSSNAIMLRAMLAAIACDVTDLGIVPDSLATLTEVFARAADAGVDVIVSTGGASVGDHDLVRPAFEAAGGTLDFWRIAMRPGKPLIAGRLRDAIMLGLPGNPASAFATGYLFLLPLVRRLAGSLSPLPATVIARLDRDMGPGGSREDYLRATLADGMARPLENQDSAGTVTLAMATCFIVRPVQAPAAPAGSLVPVMVFP